MTPRVKRRKDLTSVKNEWRKIFVSIRKMIMVSGTPYLQAVLLFSMNKAEI